jgi:chloramphenicol-sensitive protein RarD
VLSGTVPWISLTLAFTFATYGFLKKTTSLNALESLGAETLASSPIGLLLLFFSFGETGQPGPAFSWQSLSYFASFPARVWIALIFIGLASSLPLYCFAWGAKLLPLSSLGFFQFISPTLSFLLGLFFFGEHFPKQNFIAYGFIWLAIILYIISLKMKYTHITKQT